MIRIRPDTRISDFTGCRLYKRLSAVNVWLRSCNRGNANNAWNVNNSGNVNNNNAYNANRGCPDCVAPAIRPIRKIGTPREPKMQGAECPAFGPNNTSEMRPSCGMLPAMTPRTF